MARVDGLEISDNAESQRYYFGGSCAGDAYLLPGGDNDFALVPYLQAPAADDSSEILMWNGDDSVLGGPSLSSLDSDGTCLDASDDWENEVFYPLGFVPDDSAVPTFWPGQVGLRPAS